MPLKFTKALLTAVVQFFLGLFVESQCQNLVRQYPSFREKISDLGNDHRGFPAAGRRHQKLAIIAHDTGAPLFQREWGLFNPIEEAGILRQLLLHEGIHISDSTGAAHFYSIQ